MKKLNQYGFAAIEALLILAIVGIIGGAGWFVVNSKSSTSEIKEKSKTQVNDKIFTDSSNTFKFKYPGDWKIQEYKYESCCEGPIKPEPDWSKVPRPITLVPINATHKDISVYVQGGNSGNVSIDEILNSPDKDEFSKYYTFKVSGYDAVSRKTDFTGPSEEEAYVDHSTFIVNGRNSVEIYFREKYSHNWNKENNFDATNYLPAVNRIVNSIKFLK